ncbi:MAG: hypothetical protein M1832_002647 [Thelocarpon impressellum]|nr:MAG: hypothetical protein M1832_002647 [Thelocarpon impressellum]
MTSPTPPKMIRWMLDTRPLWRGEEDFAEETSSLLALLPAQERTHILRHYHRRDKGMALGSCLLKRAAISALTSEPFSLIKLSSDGNRKPIHLPLSPATTAPVEFNVSHHAGLVALLATSTSNSTGRGTRVGVDVVNTTSHDDDAKRIISQGDFAAWIATYGEVFSPRELADIEASFAGANCSVSQGVRHLAAHWALKEAYVKLTGEALLAPWLREFEFRNVRVPLPAGEGVGEESSQDACGWLMGKRVEGVVVELRAWGPDFMVATAVEGAGEEAHGGSGFDMVELHSLLPRSGAL